MRREAKGQPSQHKEQTAQQESKKKGHRRSIIIIGTQGKEVGNMKEVRAETQQKDARYVTTEMGTRNDMKDAEPREMPLKLGNSNAAQVQRNIGMASSSNPEDEQTILGQNYGKDGGCTPPNG